MVEIMVLIAVMFIIPVIWLSSETERITDNYVDGIVEEFVGSVSTNGYIDADGYERFCTKLSAAGGFADIDITCSMYITEPEYVSGSFTGKTISYTSEISNEEILKMITDNGAVLFNMGDRISVTVTRGTNTAMGLVKSNSGTTFTGSRTVSGMYTEKYTEYLTVYMP